MNRNDKKISLSSDCINQQELDRKRIANELHDTSIQDLTHIIHQIELVGLYIDLDSTKAKLELASINDELRKIIKDIRNTIFDLRPMSFDDLGLTDAISQFIDNLNNRYSVKLESDINFIDDFDNEKRLEIYRIIQECLTNSAKHADANTISLKIEDEGQNIKICVADDGIGMAEEELETDMQTHYGIQIMKERVSILNGRCYINSIKNEGTKIEIIIPR